MIVERNVFHLAFGKAKDSIALMSEAMDEMKTCASLESRMLTDLVGASYTLVLEINYADETCFDFQKSFWSLSPKLEELYVKFQSLCDWAEKDFYRLNMVH